MDVLEGEAGARDQADCRHLDPLPFERDRGFAVIEPADDDDAAAAPDQTSRKWQRLRHGFAAGAFERDIRAQPAGHRHDRGDRIRLR